MTQKFSYFTLHQIISALSYTPNYYSLDGINKDVSSYDKATKMILGESSKKETR